MLTWMWRKGNPVLCWWEGTFVQPLWRTVRKLLTVIFIGTFLRLLFLDFYFLLIKIINYVFGLKVQGLVKVDAYTMNLYSEIGDKWSLMNKL